MPKVFSNNEKIDAFFKREKRRSILSFLMTGGLFLLVSLLFVAMLAFRPMGEKSVVTGEISSVFVQSTRHGNRANVSVLLDSGQVVNVSISNARFYKKGRRVSLLKEEPLFFGGARYSLRAYQ